MAAQVQSLGLAASRPVIELGGEAQPMLAHALLSMRLRSAEEGMADAELTFGAWGTTSGGGGPRLRFMDRRLLEFGKSLKVLLGGEPLFEGRIGAIAGEFPDGGPPQVTVLAEDRLQDLRMTRRSRSFERMTPAAILQRIAGDHSLRADIGEAGPTLAVAAQLNESDLGFLTRVARAVGLDLWAEGEVLHLAAAQDGEAVALRYSGTLRRFEVTADLAHQRTALVVSGWDVARRQSVSHRADDAAAQRELAGGESGASVLNAAFGARVETLAHRAPAGAEEARAMAEGAFRHMARRFVTGTGTAEATAALRPGGRVDLQGIGPLFSGEYRVSEVTHRFDGSEGLVTDFCCQRAGIGRP